MIPYSEEILGGIIFEKSCKEISPQHFEFVETSYYYGFKIEYILGESSTCGYIQTTSEDGNIFKKRLYQNNLFSEIRFYKKHIIVNDYSGITIYTLNLKMVFSIMKELEEDFLPIRDFIYNIYNDQLNMWILGDGDFKIITCYKSTINYDAYENVKTSIYNEYDLSQIL